MTVNSSLTLGPLTATSPSFDLADGAYWIDLVDAVAAGVGWYLQKLGADGSTWFVPAASYRVPSGAYLLQNNPGGGLPGVATQIPYLPAGTYRLELSTGSPSGSYFNIVRLGTIPLTM